MFVFIFVVTAFVFVLQQASNDSINNYIDALYFTVTTLTTMGFHCKHCGHELHIRTEGIT